jgi:acyl-CoA synthetase (AMP-forming)/AMP-acid ligase II
MKKQILATVVDGMEHAQPFALYAEYPYSPTSYEAGVRKVTYRDFANAINGLAWHLRRMLGPAEDFPTLAYIGPNDLRYAALTLACVKVGYKVDCTPRSHSLLS